MAWAAGSSECNTIYLLKTILVKTRAISLEPKMGTSISSMDGIDEEFCRPRIL